MLIGNECLDSIIKTRVPSILCKLDVDKAYDHVNWEFLFYLIEMCSFGGRYSNLIKHCVSIAAHFPLLVDGKPVNFFNSYGD